MIVKLSKHYQSVPSLNGLSSEKSIKPDLLVSKNSLFAVLFTLIVFAVTSNSNPSSSSSFIPPTSDSTVNVTVGIKSVPSELI